MTQELAFKVSSLLSIEIGSPSRGNENNTLDQVVMASDVHMFIYMYSGPSFLMNSSNFNVITQQMHFTHRNLTLV